MTLIFFTAITTKDKKRINSLNIAFIGREGGKENELVTKNGIKLYTIPIHGIERETSRPTPQTWQGERK